MSPDTNGPQHVNSVRVVEVVRIELLRGSGDPRCHDPIRTVVQFWTPGGELLAEVDSWREQQEKAT